jgi:peptidoglycan/LPS O-acetylase OafA/YrhL
MRQSGHVGAIEGLRAIAVVAVVSLHMVRVGSGSTAGWAACGARGVDLFFAISGFCLTYPFLRTWRARATVDISFSQFLARRIGRIGPPYWVALFLFALMSLTPMGLPTASTHPGSASALRELGLDAVFLTNRAPVFDSSFWTLGIEMRWYLLFPLLLRLYVRSRLAFVGVGAACYVLYFFTPYSVADAGTLPCFMLGMVAADLIARRHPAIRYALPIALVTIFAAAWQQAHDDSSDLANPLWHAAAFFAVLTAGDERVARVLRFGPLAFVGVASYSVYLVHEPILESLALAGIPAPLAAILSIASGVAFYECVERPMLRPEFRERIEAALLRAFRLYQPPPGIVRQPKTSS